MRKFNHWVLSGCIIIATPVFAHQDSTYHLILKTVSVVSAIPPKFQYKVSFPLIASNKTEAAVFNEFINKLIDRNTKKFNQDQKSAKIDLPSWLSIKYKVLYFLNKRLISIIFYRDAFISGEAHPIHDTLVVNFDFMSNSNLKLVQLFRSSHFYLKEIAAYCQAVLHKRQSIQQSPVSFILQGAAPKRVNYQKWNITTKGLQVTFAPGQVAPAVAGRQVVLIPCDYISHHLKASFHYICHPTR